MKHEYTFDTCDKLLIAFGVLLGALAITVFWVDQELLTQWRPPVPLVEACTCTVTGATALGTTARALRVPDEPVIEALRQAHALDPAADVAMHVPLYTAELQVRLSECPYAAAKVYIRLGDSYTDHVTATHVAQRVRGLVAIDKPFLCYIWRGNFSALQFEDRGNVYARGRLWDHLDYVPLIAYLATYAMVVLLLCAGYGDGVFSRCRRGHQFPFALPIAMAGALLLLTVFGLAIASMIEFYTAKWYMPPSIAVVSQ